MNTCRELGAKMNTQRFCNSLIVKRTVSLVEKYLVANATGTIDEKLFAAKLRFPSIFDRVNFEDIDDILKLTSS